MIVAVIQARIESQRLPGKTLMDIEGKPMLSRVIERVQMSGLVNRVVVATTIDPADDRIVDLASKHGVDVFRGCTLDVVDRYYQAVKALEREAIILAVVRICGDCPLIDPKLIDRTIDSFFAGEYDYITNRPSYPDGMDVEVFSFAALERAWREAESEYDKEHVTPYIRDHPEMFKVGEKRYGAELSIAKLSVDTQADLDYVRLLYRELGEYCGLEAIIGWEGLRCM